MTTKSAKTNGMTTKSAFSADFNRQDVITTLNNAFCKGNGMTPLPLDIDDAANFREAADAANIEKALHIGDYPNRIAVYDIILKPNCHIARARVGIKRLVTKLMDNYSYAILLFHYEDAANKEWRISWVTKGGSSSQTNAAKRYTFLCGKMHLARTIVDRLSNIDKSSNDLASEITKAFSVEALSDEFFDEYKAFYEDIVQYICGARYVKGAKDKYERKEIESKATIDQRGLFAKFVEQAINENPKLNDPITKTDPKEKKDAEEAQKKANVDAAEKLVRNYVKKLLGRLVFIQFLAKKGWMGLKQDNACNPAKKDNEWGNGDKHFLFNLYQKVTPQDKANFVHKVLNDILFDSLNNNPGGKTDLFGVKINAKGQYKYPYLNGGLFEENDLDKLDITIPGYFFVSDDIARNGKEYAEDEANATKNNTRKYMGIPSSNAPYPYSDSEGLFEFFERYNFTIDENGSDEAVVGIDPEMLGKIFENLLEDNKDKGAFYTPKPVVEYMCQQSLIAYLQNGVLKGVQNGSLQNSSLQNGVQNLSVGSTALQNGVLNGVQSGAKNTLQNGAQQTTLQNSNEISTTNTSSDELQKANLAFIRDSLTEGEIKAQIEHFVKTKSLDIETSVETRQGLGEVVIESGSESATKKDNERAESAPKKDNEGADAGSKIESAESGSENGSAEPTTKEKPKPQMSIEMVSLLNHLLKEVKICDPAIGSGAFPMGLLNELLECREVLALRLIDEGRKDEVFADK